MNPIGDVACRRRATVGALKSLLFGGALVAAESTHAQEYFFSRFAGDPSNTAGAADGASSNARFNNPHGLAVDPSGNLYVADTGNHAIRKISMTGVVTTFAGTPGMPGNSDGPIAEARFNSPNGIAIGPTGTMYVTDSGNHSVRMILPNGTVTTLATFADFLSPPLGVVVSSHPHGIAVDADGSLFVVDRSLYLLRKMSADGNATVLAGASDYSLFTPTTDGFGSAARFLTPEGCSLDPTGDLFIADTDNNAIRKVTRDGYVSTLAGHLSTSGAYPGYADALGTDARFSSVKDVACAPSGFVFAADGTRIRRISPTGFVTTVAGGPHQYTGHGLMVPPYFADGAGSHALFQSVQGILALSDGTVFVSDSNRICKGTPVPSPKSWLANLSLRCTADSTEGGLIAGFTTSDVFAKRFLLRGIGPSLRKFGVADSASAAALALLDPSTGQRIASNNAWADSEGVIAAAQRVGAFGLPEGSADAAVDVMVQGGAHTLHITAPGTAGEALAEIYDDDPDIPTTRLINLSGRAIVADGHDLIAGFVIFGTAPKTVLIRGIGPTLARFSIANPLPSAALTLFNARGAVLARNSAWSSDETLSAVFQKVGAFALPAGSADAALSITLPPGVYSVKLSPRDGAPGVGLVELYEVEDAL